uniref:Uncharacterized protein n=1 Tax=Rhizophora mucronata TaxID=61149 RepID=A0A2P2Q9J3_RHIMU
MLLFGYFILPI